MLSWLRALVDFLDDPKNAALFRALAAAASENREVSDRLYQRFSGPLHTSLVECLRAGVRTGRIRDDAPVRAVADVLIGAVLHRALAHIDIPSARPTGSWTRFFGHRRRGPRGTPITLTAGEGGSATRTEAPAGQRQSGRSPEAGPGSPRMIDRHPRGEHAKASAAGIRRGGLVASQAATGSPDRSFRRRCRRRHG
ncbi:TetR-like C-terminal domain-containing protein [Streptosporangium lutulentum]